MLDILNSAARASLVTFVLCGFAYPLTVTMLGQWLMPFQANGSLIKDDHGTVLGSELIGQQWNDPQWFRGRPSATTDTDPNDATKTIPAPYNAVNSSGSNLGPTSKTLEDRLLNDWRSLDDAEPDVTWNALPADMLTTSGSGLDPDISPANAASQVKRVAKIRGVPPESIAALVERYVNHRSLGVFGEPRVNVLQLNLTIVKEFPMK